MWMSVLEGHPVEVVRPMLLRDEEHRAPIDDRVAGDPVDLGETAVEADLQEDAGRVRRVRETPGVLGCRARAASRRRWAGRAASPAST